MRSKSAPPRSAFTGQDLAPLIEAYFELNQLKVLYRQGWLRRGIPPERCESVAEHVFGMAMLAWWIAGAYFPLLDPNKILRMVLAHELGEIYTGDLVPGDQVPAEAKHRLEREGLLRVVGKLPSGAEILALWEEYEAVLTPEARFVKQVDRLEMAFQAAIYEKQGLGDMSEFFASAGAGVLDEPLRAILSELEDLR